MSRAPRPVGHLEQTPDSLPVIACVSVVAGAAAGLVGALFRLALAQADRFREWGLAELHARLGASPVSSVIGLVLVMATCGVAGAIAAWMVRRFAPVASGSGIPHVESVLVQELPMAPYRLVPVKFVGGILAIGSGMALGREGPSVQMGATVAHFVGRLFRRNTPDCLVLLASGAGAGLATAFNAPIAGAIFVLEELVRRFDTRIAIATFGASTGAITVARVFLGQKPDFSFDFKPYTELATVPLDLLLGVFAGLLAVAYNKVILGTLSATDRMSGWPVELRALLIGAVVGLIAWYGPSLVGGGDSITQRTLDWTDTVPWILFVFVVRFALGPLSYAARTPGGLFAPLLVLGAQLGLVYGIACQRIFPEWAPDPRVLAVVGMAAFFTGVVRAPLTGITLVTEMTGGFTLLLPMLSACFTAMLVPTLLRNEPIYDALRQGTSSMRENENRAAPPQTQATDSEATNSP
jgi:chloride channel protein, CIC family